MKLKMPKFKFSKKSIIIAVAVVLVIVIALVGFFSSRKKTQGSGNSFSEYTVGKGNISVVISGSGTIQANEQYDITSLVTGDVLASYFEEGDVVEEGAVLYEIDTKNIENSIEKAKNSVETAKMSYDDAREDVENLNLKSDCSGVITKVYIKAGDTVSKGTKVADVINNSILVLNIPFNENDAENLYVGESVTVRLESTAYELPGKIAKISTGATASSTGVSVKTVRIEIENPGTLRAGEKAIAYTSRYACNEAGILEVYEENVITAEVGGEVDWISVGVGDKVTKGQKIAQITSKSATTTVRRSALSYNDAQLNLDNLYENMSDYTITAPISGTVISKTTKAGDKLDNTNKSTVMAVVADMSRMLFEISVDELDIAKLKVNQKVRVTADALEGKFFNGYIDKISIIGTTSNGVTTYPVTVVIEEHEGLIPGMNVDAQITVEEVNDVVTVPVSAIMRGNMVAVKSDGKAPKTEDTKQTGEKGNRANAESEKNPMQGSNKAFGMELPDGFELRRVEIGISNSDSVEIISGLEEGDVILVQQVQSTSLQNMMMSGMPMGGRAMGGGMPAGGMNGNRGGNMSGGGR